MTTPKNAAKLRIFQIAIPATGILVFWLLYSSYQAPTMKSLQLSNDGFRVNLPCQSHSKTSSADSPFGTQSQTDHICDADGVTYVVGYTDLPTELLEPLEKAQNTQALIEEYTANMLGRTRGKLLSSQAYPGYGNYTIGVHGDSGWASKLQPLLPRFLRNTSQTPQHSHVMIGRLQLQGGRLYMMNVLRPEPPSYNQELYANRALRSFQVPQLDKTKR
ncbi:MAG: hypothetical protein RSD57_17655 [Comamonas sp.]